MGTRIEVACAGLIRESQVAWCARVHVGSPTGSDGAVVPPAGSAKAIFEAAVRKGHDSDGERRAGCAVGAHIRNTKLDAVVDARQERGQAGGEHGADRLYGSRAIAARTARGRSRVA